MNIELKKLDAEEKGRDPNAPQMTQERINQLKSRWDRLALKDVVTNNGSS